MSVHPLSESTRYQRWMGDLPVPLTQVPLSCLAIPGSHDSGAYGLDKSAGVSVDASKSVKLLGSLCCGAGLSVVSRWSVTQDLTLGQQLQAGIRYFDLRVCIKPGTADAHFLHGLYGSNILTALSEVNEFLSKNIKEFLILDFNHFYNMDAICHKQLLTGLKHLFGASLIPVDVSMSPWQMTLENIWKTQMRVLIFYNDESSANMKEFWPNFSIPSPWPNTDDPRVLVEFLEKNYTGKNRNNNGDFYVWQGVLTPGAKVIMANLWGSLRDSLVPRASRAFLEWVAGKEPSPQGINICLGDFVHLHDFIPSVLRLNDNIQP
ncbi:PI-PLC X domain-containing protein 2-like [Mizuhopecten yessoensis]|uniref:PI-PLC X domain-containing protein 3 n=1 Tax=Mizuhopecten yessoensis TaxID=6573 RepID=A0A210Q1G6_MIZYE|nr:PI-PLC X domain-containing protein 2-like [Mizuhopecten yessoensis]OWF42509.1 PI-PLC X domain-containing protein 3 [Mizuhopecten yessoensis]